MLLNIYAQFKVSGSCIPRVSLSFAVTQYFWSDANVKNISAGNVLIIVI